MFTNKEAEIGITGEIFPNVRRIDCKKELAMSWKKTTFKNFSEIATVHGLYRVGHAVGWVRTICWGILFISLFCVVATLTSSTIVQHFSYPVLTEVKHVTTSSIKFPSMTICHANNFRMSAFKKYDENVEKTISELVSSTIMKSLLKHEIITPLKSDVAYIFNSFYHNSTTMKNFSSSIVEKNWNFKDWCMFSLSAECKYPDDFVDYYYHSSIGFCKTFNTKGNYTQIAPGYPFGISIKLFIDQWDKVPLLSEQGDGILLMVHPQNVYPNPFAEAVSLPTGKETYVSLRKVVFERQKSPYETNCTEGKGIFLIYPGQYTVINCQYSCFVRNFMEKCGFIESAYQFHKPMEFAKSLKHMKEKVANSTNSEEMLECVQKTTAAIIQGEEKCYCPPACREEKYIMKLSQTNWPSSRNIDYYQTLIAKFSNRENATAQDVYNSVISLKVYFNEIAQDIIKEKPVSQWLDLFSKIGGHFGLWLGASIFSIFEICVFLAQWILSSCQGKVEPRKEDSKKIEVITLK